MRPFSFAFCLTALLSTLTPAHASESQKITVLELYTSQGCSSCPKADAYLGELTQRRNLITMACHVDYWNYLGWKDPYALPICSARQRATASVSGDKRVYTPAMLINGERSIVGHDKPDIEILIKKARAIPKIPVAYTAGTGTLSYQLPPILKGDVVSLVTIGKDEVTSVSKGENRGRKVPAARPVLRIDPLLTRSGLTHIKLNPPANAAGYVILVNDGNGGPVKAAGQVHL